MPPLRSQSPATADSIDDQQGFATSVSDSALAEALQVLRKRKWIALAVCALGLLYGLYQALTQPIQYTASGKIQVGSGATAAYRDAGSSGIGSTQNLNNEMLILQSDSLMLTVAREMDLANNVAFFGATAPLAHSNIEDPATQQLVVGRLLNSLSITLIPGTQIITITAVSPNPRLSADMVNHVMDAYIQRSYQVRFALQDRVSRWLSKQLGDLKAQVETSQEQLIDMQRKLGVLGLAFDPTRPPTQRARQRSTRFPLP